MSGQQTGFAIVTRRVTAPGYTEAREPWLLEAYYNADSDLVFLCGELVTTGPNLRQVAAFDQILFVEGATGHVYFPSEWLVALAREVKGDTFSAALEAVAERIRETARGGANALPEGRADDESK